MKENKEEFDDAPSEKEDSVDASEAEKAAIESEEQAETSGSNSGGDREMFKATCAECGGEAEVPFKPDEGKDVYCRECYQKRRPKRSFNDRGGRGGGFRSGGGNRGGGFRSGGGNRGSFGQDRQMFKATCAKCGKEAEVPFKPNGKKPVLCGDCFRKDRN